MKVNQIADAISIEIGNITVVEVCRYLNTMIGDLSHRLAEIGYQTISTLSSIVPDQEFTEVTLDADYFVKNVFVGAEELSKVSIADSFKFLIDSRGLPFYTIEGRRLRVTYNEPIPLKIRVINKIELLEEPFTGALETNIPDYMLNYVIYSVGAKMLAKEGNWSRQGYYKNMANKEANLIKVRYSSKYEDNWGGSI